MSTSNAAATADYLKAWQKLDMESAFRDIHPHATYTGAQGIVLGGFQSPPRIYSSGP